VECYKCNNFGHMAKYCRMTVPPREPQQNNNSHRQEPQKRTWIRKKNQYSNEECTLALQAKKKKRGWYVDSGCSKHEEQVNKDQVPEIARLEIKRDEENSTEKRKDVRYKKIWKITERKEGQVNKEQVQEIVLSGTVVKDESTDRKKEVRAQRDDESTNEDDDEYTSE
jgi:hypothetical protein